MKRGLEKRKGRRKESTAGGILIWEDNTRVHIYKFVKN